MPFRGPASRLEIPADNVRLLGSAAEFRDLLFEKLEKSSKRCILTSLYIGAEQQGVFDLLVKKAEQGLQVWTMTDYSRSLRPDGPKKCRSTATEGMREAVFRRGGVKTSWRAYLYLSPCKYKWQRWFPYRLQETLGVLHWKFYIFDDDVILTGANIATTYLTNRHDRWMLFENCRELCDTLIKLGELWHPCCHQLILNDDYHQSTIAGPTSGRPTRSIVKVNGVRQTLSIYEPWKDKNECLVDVERFLSTVQHFTEDCATLPANSLNKKVRLSLGIHCGYGPDQSLLKLTEPEFMVKALRGPTSSTSRAELILATPYCNLAKETIDLLGRELGKSRTLCVVGPSPNASSFYNAGPITSAIPWSYVMLTLAALNALARMICVNYRAFVSQAESTFHAKGIWHISEPSHPNGSQTDDNEPPVNMERRALTIAGSTNFGLRSLYRDLECLFLIDTTNLRLVQALESEADEIRKLSEPHDLQSLRLSLANLNWLTKIIARFFATHPFFRSLL